MDCGASLSRTPRSSTPTTGPNVIVCFEPAIDTSIKPELLEILEEWQVSSKEAILSVHLIDRNYPLPHVDMLRQLLEQGWIRPETAVLHQNNGRWFEAKRFPGLKEGEAFDPEHTQELELDEPSEREKGLSVDGRSILAAKLGREAESAASSGDISRAVAIYEEVLQVNPRYPLAGRRLRELRAVLSEDKIYKMVPSGGTKPTKEQPATIISQPVQNETQTVILSELDVIKEETKTDDQAFAALHFEDTAHEIRLDLNPLVARKIPRTIENTLDDLLSSAVIPKVSSQLFDNLTFSHHSSDIDWEELKRLFHKAGEVERTTVMLKKAFSQSQHVCFLYFDVELIGSVRALSDGVFCATICDLVISPRFPQQLICSALVGALLEELEVKRVFLIDGLTHLGSLRSLGFQGAQDILLRTEEEN